MKLLYIPTIIALSASSASALHIPIPIPIPRPKPACTLPCPSSAVCIADPKPRCVVPDGFCGGLAAFTCEAENHYCVDDPTDDCDPGHGGYDCGGVCVQRSNVTCS